MKKTKLYLIAFGLGFVLAPAPVGAQGGPPPGDPDCAACASCELCVPSHWGGEGCNYKGGECKCQEIGGNCNLGSGLSVGFADRRTIEADGEAVALVRLARNVFGAWDCDGELRVAYREDAGGVLVQVAATDFVFYKSLYGFERYVGLLADRMLQLQHSTQG